MSFTKNMSDRRAHLLIKPSIKPIEHVCENCNGSCCKRVDQKTREIYSCQYLDENNLCSIFEYRPIACRLDNRYHSKLGINFHCQVSQLSLSKLMTQEEATMEIFSTLTEKTNEN